MKRITKVFKDLMTPDAQEQSWYGWVTNQLSHAFLGAIVALFAGAYWFIAVVVLAVTKEGFDLYRAFNSHALIDSLNDILFWIGGAGLVSDAEHRVFYAVGLFILLAIGVYFRIKK